MISYSINSYVLSQRQHIMREWLSGGAPPCQGGGRGFDPRLALLNKEKDIRMDILFLVREVQGTSLEPIIA